MRLDRIASTRELRSLSRLRAGESHMKKTRVESRLARGRCSTDAFAIPGLIPIRSRSDSVPQRSCNSVMLGQLAEETREFSYAIALRLRGRVGVGVSPRFALLVWREPPPASHRLMRHSRSFASASLSDGRQRRPMLPRKRERCSESAAGPIQPTFITL